MICSSYVNFDQEIKYLEKMFVKNSYPVNFFQKTVRSFLNRKFSDVLIVENSERKYILKIPFVGKPSMDFKNAFSKLFNAYFDFLILCHTLLVLFMLMLCVYNPLSLDFIRTEDQIFL